MICQSAMINQNSLGKDNLQLRICFHKKLLSFSAKTAVVPVRRVTCPACGCLATIRIMALQTAFTMSPKCAKLYDQENKSNHKDVVILA